MLRYSPESVRLESLVPGTRCVDEFEVDCERTLSVIVLLEKTPGRAKIVEFNPKTGEREEKHVAPGMKVCKIFSEENGETV